MAETAVAKAAAKSSAEKARVAAATAPFSVIPASVAVTPTVAERLRRLGRTLRIASGSGGLSGVECNTVAEALDAEAKALDGHDAIVPLPFGRGHEGLSGAVLKERTERAVAVQPAVVTPAEAVATPVVATPAGTVDLSTLTVDEAKAKIAKAPDKAALDALEAQETAGKDRVGVHEAIDRRLEELEGDTK